MYYLLKNPDDNSYAIRSFPQELASINWTSNILYALTDIANMRTVTAIDTDSIEEYMKNVGWEREIVISWDTLPSVEQFKQQYPELLI